ncbi:MAG: hypothetical protein WBA10_17545 [Elainellaceae cyanobacterium]
MTSNRAKLQALIDTIDSAFGESSTPEAQARQQEAIAQMRRYLLEQQQEGGKSQEATAQQVLQAVVQEMSYLRSNMIQPLREEITQLHGERKLLADDLRQLQQRQQQIKASQQQEAQQKMLQDFMQSLMVRLQDQMTTQVVQAITLMQPQLSAGSPSADGVPATGSAEQAEQLRALQATSNELMLKMDSTLRVVFDSLQTTVDSYRESLGQGLEKMHSLGQQGETLFAALVNRLASQLGREASQYLSQSLSAEWEASRLDKTRPLSGDWQSARPSMPQPTTGASTDADMDADIDGGVIAGNPFSEGAPDVTATADASAISADQIDQLLRQNLPQTASSTSDEADTSLAPDPNQIDPDALIDQILQDLEADISAIGEGLDLNLDAVDLASDETSTTDTPDEAIALFQLGDEGVTVNESAEPSGERFDASHRSGSDEESLSEDLPPDDSSSGDAPETDTVTEEQLSVSGQGDGPASNDEIASFYAEFQAATELPPEGSDSSLENDADGEPSAPEQASLLGQPLAAESSPPSVDTINRLSDLIDTDLLMQMGAEDASGVSSPYTMASLGEDLLPTVSDATPPTANLDINLDQLTADLSRIEGAQAGDSETRAAVSGFLSPDDDFFAIEESESESDVRLEPMPDTVEESSQAPFAAAPEPEPDVVDGEDSASAPISSAPISSEPISSEPDPNDPLSDELASSEQTVSDPSQPDTRSETSMVDTDDLIDDDLIDDAAIDEIAALFAALERTEDSPSGRSAIAEQTLADLLKPTSDSTSGSSLSGNRGNSTLGRNVSSTSGPSASSDSANSEQQEAGSGDDQKKK